MKNQTIYFEAGLPATLIPVQFIGWAKSPLHDVTGCVNAVVKVRRTAQGYRAGEVLHVPSNFLVVKAGRKDYFQMVKPALLPAVDKSKLMDSRV